MFEIIEKEIIFGENTLSLQTGKIARQADGAVVASCGETKVLATVVFNKNPNWDLDFFPLTVNYQDKYYAAGKIPGGFFKREGRPSEKEILISRLIDRPMRPLFDEKLRYEVQVVVSVLNYDGVNSVDVLSIIAASAALAISGFPMRGIVGASKVAYINDAFVLNPTFQQLSETKLDLVVAGTKEGVLMVESEAHELSESTMLEAVQFAHKSFANVISLIEDFKTAVNKAPFAVDVIHEESKTQLQELIMQLAGDRMKAAFSIVEKVERSEQIAQIKADLLAGGGLSDILPDVLTKYFDPCFKELSKNIVRQSLLYDKQRIDGRAPTDIRPIATEVGFLPHVHGSALFTRGETQALVFTTLGTGQDEQIIDSIEGEDRSHFMLHYNFPGYSVGEVSRMFGPGRREIGHGKLAWRAIKPVLPKKEAFPYTIRVVSEITESNGSSSMATVCGASMSLMSAGVSMEAPVAGIAMGLIKEQDDFVVLSDILGDEDYLGDMDFKVAGTSKGITALQMDIKITSVGYSIMQQALQQAYEGRIHILSKMGETISQSATQVSDRAPRINSFDIPKEKIKDVIGSGGKVIRELSSKYNVKIEISDDAIVSVYGSNQNDVELASDMIKQIVTVPKVGQVYKGTVVKIIESGAFINILPNADGFLHISAITNQRGDDINDFIKVKDSITVKIVDVDFRGKIKLRVQADETK